MPAVLGDNLDATVQFFFEELQDLPPPIVPANAEVQEEQIILDDNDAEFPPLAQPVNAANNNAIAQAGGVGPAAVHPLPGIGLAAQHLLQAGEGLLAHWNHWLVAHQAHQHHQHNHGFQAALLNNMDIDLDIDALAAIPNMHLVGIVPEDIVTFFHASGNPSTPHHNNTMRSLKKRILILRERKPHYWHRVAFGLYKRTLRGLAGGCDARISVREGSLIWVHKFIVVNNPVFLQMFGYSRVEECLQDEGGTVAELDIPNIDSETMRDIVMNAYDLPVHRLTLDSALNLENWAVKFCMDDLARRCRTTIRLAPER